MTTESDERPGGERAVVHMASGCLYACYVVAVSSGMLFVNALFCLALYAAVPKNDSQTTSQIGQLFFFVVPLIMLIVEWNLLDRLQRLFRSE